MTRKQALTFRLSGVAFAATFMFCGVSALYAQTPVTPSTPATTPAKVPAIAPVKVPSLAPAKAQ